jgi:hypothetical protein
MASYAHIQNNIVDAVIVIEPDVLAGAGGWFCPECQRFANENEWLQTSYNTEGGVHKLGGTPLRKNFAGKGYQYDSVRDAFIPPKPFDSWSLDEDRCQWKAPKDKPDDGKLKKWDENGQDWVDVIIDGKVESVVTEII